MINHNPIIEVSPGVAVVDIQTQITLLTTAIGLVVPDDDNLDCRAIIRGLPVPCAGIAFIYNKRMGYMNRLRLTLSLSRHHACPCHLVRHKEDAYLWLQQRLRTM